MAKQTRPPQEPPSEEAREVAMEAAQAPPLLDPDLAPADAGVQHWLAQVTLRLRREIAWVRHQRQPEGGADGEGQPTAFGSLPPFTDAAQDSLDLLRHRQDKLDFFANDPAARYLGEQLDLLTLARSQAADAWAAAQARPSTEATEATEAAEASKGSEGSEGGEPTEDDGAASRAQTPAPPQDRWAAIAQALQLDEAAQFTLACALAARADAALGPVCAAALNDASRPYPSLALAQRLWDAPLDLVPCADPTHILYRAGLLRPAGGDWNAPLDMPAPVAQALLADAPERTLPAALRPLAGIELALPPAALALAHWLAATPRTGMQLVPVVTLRGADTAAWAATLAEAAGARLAALAEDIAPTHPGLPGLACAAWLHGADLLAPDSWARALPTGHEGGGGEAAGWTAPLAAIAVRWWLPVGDAAQARAPTAALVAPAFELPPLPTAERARRLRELARRTLEPGPAQDEAVEWATESARRFRLQARSLARIERVLASQPYGWGKDDLLALCRAEAAVDMSQLAQAASPRFQMKELVLPPRAHAQLRAIADAMRTLHRVHEDWGLGPVWNEAGLAVMFCGPPGTGKTMAAEALANELQLPMYRIDLSQVINKYIGETEKNLRRIFDAAEAADCLLFFDEADALFGKRTEVKDAHDRFANIEISYLLERMERFKGLAVLATNRRKDLDEAFVRRLRYIVEFPVPGVAERTQIWRQVFPPAVDAHALDLPFLAEHFELAGGSIRSAAFNACGQAAVRARRPQVGMGEVLLAIKRELEKAGREVADEQFAHYAPVLAAAEGGAP